MSIKAAETELFPGDKFVINVMVEAEHVELLKGEPVTIEVSRDDGNKQRIMRCPTSKSRC